MPSDDLINKVAQAMKAKREELIAQPISRIWDDLATVAIDVIKEVMEEPSEKMVRAMPNFDPHEWNAMFKASPLGDSHD